MSGPMASLVPLRPSVSALLPMSWLVSRNSRSISLISLMQPTWMPFVFSLKHSLHEQDQIDQPDNQKRYRTVMLGFTVVTTRRRETMTDHKIGIREEWLAARLELLEAEKALTRRSDELARWRQELPWVRIDKEYRFETDEGTASLADLFRGRSQLLIYHFMFGPEYTAGCPNCSAIADGFDGSVVHLANHDVTLCAVSRAPLAKLQAYKRRMGWSFPWASSFGSDFNHDFQVAHTREEWQSGAVEYNFRERDFRPPEGSES